MPMQVQPEGTSRTRLTPAVENPETGKLFPATAFGIYYKDPDHGKVKIGETHRIVAGKRRGHWEPHTQVPSSALKGVQELLEPLKRHNDAIEHLLGLWRYARERGWCPEGAPKPAQAPADIADRQEQNRDAVEAALASPVPPEELPEMQGVPVSPVPPGTDLADFQIPAAAKTDGATSVETGAVTRVIPAGHPDDPSTNGQGPTPPGEPIVLDMLAPPVEGPHNFNPIPSRLPGPVPQADPEVQQEVVLADDWLNQPPTPAPAVFADPFAADAFPLDFPSDDDRHPVQ